MPCVFSQHKVDFDCSVVLARKADVFRGRHTCVFALSRSGKAGVRYLSGAGRQPGLTGPLSACSLVHYHGYGLFGSATMQTTISLVLSVCFIPWVERREWVQGKQRNGISSAVCKNRLHIFIYIITSKLIYPHSG